MHTDRHGRSKFQATAENLKLLGFVLNDDDDESDDDLYDPPTS